MERIGIFSTDTKTSTELYLYECGYEHCQPRDPYQYEQINYYLIHYIIEGEGLFFINNEVHRLKKGDGFLIPPFTDNNYYPIIGNPWVYRWIGINGTQVESLLSKCGFSKDNYIFHYDADNQVDHHFEEIYNRAKSGELYHAVGHIYQFLSLMMSQHSTAITTHAPLPQQYIKDAIDYIHEHSHENINVSHIADYLKINRSYFFKIFKKYMMISPQDYIIDYKIKQSCELLRKSSYSIAEISSIVGFSSPSYFSKAFKKQMETTPLHYREHFIK